MGGRMHLYPTWFMAAIPHYRSDYQERLVVYLTDAVADTYHCWLVCRYGVEGRIPRIQPGTPKVFRSLDRTELSGPRWGGGYLHPFAEALAEDCGVVYHRTYHFDSGCLLCLGQAGAADIFSSDSTDGEHFPDSRLAEKRGMVWKVGPDI